ncbi:MAG: sigma-70 family RNA polymerase sigma factor [Syntrophorhabdales bacterium]|jgi:RNA polymerase sigma-32 factor
MNSPRLLENSTASEPESETSEVRDPLRAYLREVSKHPLMTREEERAIAQRVRMGDKEARQTMVVANLRLVVRIALHYRSHLNLLDLIQEGNIGLMRAVGKYDPEMGIRFSTYATFWIRARMQKYLIDTWSMVKIGTTDSHRRLFYSLKREKERLERSGILPSARLLADNLDATALEIEDMEQRLYHGDVSLEAPQYGDGNPLMDTIRSTEDIEGALIEKDTAEMLHKRLGDFKRRLNEKECFILDNRIMAEDPLTLEEIGQRFNTSRERVRQIEVKISKNLARNLRSSKIRPSK